ncbi:MAG: hypothetical protein L0Y73_00105 [Candidatus Aminicenantes bacterium]|nr:hypothetical protein [Candidatus Aminicenantes bacterium]
MIKENKKDNRKKIAGQEIPTIEDAGNPHPSPEPAGIIDYDNSTTYFKDPKSGRWIVRNPAGSIAYNCLYRQLTSDSEQPS